MKRLVRLLVVAAGVASLLVSAGGSADAQQSELAMTISQNGTLVDGSVVTISVTGTTGSNSWIALCPTGTNVQTDTSACLTREGVSPPSFRVEVIESDATSVTFTAPVRRTPAGRQSPDCAFTPCEFVYNEVDPSGARSEVRVAAGFAAAPPPFSASPTDDLVIGDSIEVEYNQVSALPTPNADETVSGPIAIVGICTPRSLYSGFGSDGFGYDERYCDEISLGADELSGSVTLTATRFVDTVDGRVDCLDLEFDGESCFVGYSNYVVFSGPDFGSEAVLVDAYAATISYRESVSINSGQPTAPVGSSVPIEAYGQPTEAGAVGFVMLCNLDPELPGFAGLACSDVGTVETDFDGQLVGGITLPATMTANGRTYDCRVGRGCLVVYAAIDSDLQTIGGSGRFVRAVDTA